MKIKQLLGTGSIAANIKESKGSQCGGKRAKSENEELTAITSKDYDVWCKQIGMKGEDVSPDEFREVAWEVIDNDPKLGATSEAEKGKIISKLWKMHQS